jgi:molybdenum cofactor cytidylyltransferase
VEANRPRAEDPDAAGGMRDGGMGDVAGLLLAAGAGRRFAAAGGTDPKLLSEVAGRPLIAHAVDGARRSGLEQLLVVLPPAADALRNAVLAAHATARIEINVDAATGMASSVVAGLDALDPAGGDGAPAACVVLLADQPGIDATVIHAVVAAWRRTGRPARARYDDGPGHPVVLPREVWSRIRDGLRGTGDGPAGGTDAGARGLLADLDVLEVVIAGPAPVDVDVPQDLHRAPPTQRTTQAETTQAETSPAGTTPDGPTA